MFGRFKKYLETINELTFRKRNKNGSPTEIEVNGITTQDLTQIAEAFSSYFSSLGSNLGSQIAYSNTSPLSYMSERMQSSFFEVPSTDKAVQLVINKLNCRSGYSNAIPHKIYFNSCSCIKSCILCYH